MNSKTKIFGISLVLILGVVLLMGAGCVKKAVTPTPGVEEEAPAGGAPAVEEPAPAPVSEMNDDLYVELTAQTNYHLGQADMNWLGEDGGWEQLLKSKGVTEEQFTAYGEQSEGGLTNALRLIERITKRIEELSK